MQYSYSMIHENRPSLRRQQIRDAGVCPVDLCTLRAIKKGALLFVFFVNGQSLFPVVVWDLAAVVRWCIAAKCFRKAAGMAAAGTMCYVVVRYDMIWYDVR